MHWILSVLGGHFYKNGYKSTKRVTIIVVLHAISVMVIIRYFVLSVFNTPFTKYWLCDGNHLLGGEPRLFALAIATSQLTVKLFQLSIHLAEWTDSIHAFSLLADIKDRKTIVTLGPRYQQRFARIVNLLANICIDLLELIS